MASHNVIPFLYKATASFAGFADFDWLKAYSGFSGKLKTTALRVVRIR
jgi:hypothetical protein